MAGRPRGGGGRRGVVTLGLSMVDTEILRFLMRVKYARTSQIAGWVGCTVWWASQRLAKLQKQELILPQRVTPQLRNAEGRIVPAQSSVWVCTGRGATAAGEWAVPSVPSSVRLTTGRWSPGLVDHTLGVTDLMIRFRRTGWSVVAEREITRLERPGTGKTPAGQWWCVQADGKLHVPDFGLVDPRSLPGGVGGFGAVTVEGGPDRWVGELERRKQTVPEYRSLVAAMETAGLGQVWFMRTRTAATNMDAACKHLGIELSPGADGITWVSANGRVRVSPWRPGPVAGARTTEDMEAEYGLSPAAMPVVGPPPSPARLAGGELVDGEVAGDEWWTPDMDTASVGVGAVGEDDAWTGGF